MEKKNYLKEYYQRKEEIDLSSILQYNEDNEMEITKLKKEMRALQKQVEQKSVELEKEVSKAFSKNYEPIQERIIIKYNGRNETCYFDLESGLREYGNTNENCVVYTVNSKREEIIIAVGYVYDLASIVFRTIRVNVSKDNSFITTQIVEQSNISFMENKGTTLQIKTNEKVQIDSPYGISSFVCALRNINCKQFISNLYGIEEEMSFKASLEDMRSYNLTNQSFEIILKTAPKEILEKLLSKRYEVNAPIHKLLGVTVPTYNEAIKMNLIKELYNIVDLLKEENLNKTEMEILDFLENCKRYQEDLEFYGAKTRQYYGYEDQNLEYFILNTYLKNHKEYSYSGAKIDFTKYYSLNKFLKYVVEETINQGYQTVQQFVEDLQDYLRMCELDETRPILYSSYLKQTHDITVRNHKIKVNREMEDCFKSRYKNFVPYTVQEKKDEKGKVIRPTYYIIAPSCTKDLQNEGCALGHCVATYIKRVADGECTILFLRTKKDESLVTMEIRGNRICQVKGKGNRLPNDEEVEVIKEFATKRKMETKY